MRIPVARSASAAHHLRSVSVIALCVAVTGCAGNVMRFSDNFYTNAVPSRPPAPVQSTYPGGVTPPAPAPTYAPQVAQVPIYATNPQYQPVPVYRAQPQYTPTVPQPTDNFTTASVGGVPTVARTPLPAAPAVAPPPVSAPAPVAAPTPSYPAAPTTPSVASAPAAAAPTPSSAGEGWTRTGGTYITMREGETVYNLAKRYGVPANAIMEANDIKDAKAVRAGQRVLIPVYVYSRTAPNSTPDADPNVRSASSSVGGRSDVPISSAPTPASRPQAAATPAPQPAPASTNGGRYVVVSGDTLYGISRKTGASVSAIRRTNNLTTDNLRIGQALIIPGLSGSGQTANNATLDRTTTGSSPSVTPPPAVNQPAPYTPPTVSTIDKSSTASAPSGTGLKSLRWPATGRIVSAFGSNLGGKPNDGIDISMPVGTPVKAAENGTVIYAGDGLKELGKTILVRHGDGLVTVYGHVNEIKVERGATVSRGQTIASSGMTGAARQPQLHFEVRKDTKPVDPTKYLN
ncbi:MAG: peptidoglycan DD-metalloendopeptidase family protein [Pseudomonadota bacterium]